MPSDICLYQDKHPHMDDVYVKYYYTELAIMPRSTMLKIDLLARIYKEKTKLYEKENTDTKTDEWYSGAHSAYNTMLDILNEYRQ